MIKPSRGYVLIEPEKAEEQTSAGVYLPEKAQDKPEKGIIISIGKKPKELMEVTKPEATLENYLEAKAGDKVYYKKWAGTEIKYEGKDYVFVKFEDILGVIDGE